MTKPQPQTQTRAKIGQDLVFTLEVDPGSMRVKVVEPTTTKGISLAIACTWACWDKDALDTLGGLPTRRRARSNEVVGSEAMKTCGDCKHSKIPAPKMGRHKVPRVVETYPGRCVCPLPPLPMVSTEPHRTSVWADFAADTCPCFEPREVKP